MKKAIKISGIVVCAVVLFCNVSLNGKSNSNSTTLASLSITNNANAECTSNSMNGGRCSALERCYWGGSQCDWTK